MKVSGAGRLEAIWVKRTRGEPMDSVSGVAVRAGQGLEGNAHQGGKRQVTILSDESWEDVQRLLQEELDPQLRRANLLVCGVDLAESRGRILRVGGCRILIRGETRPCPSMEESFPGLRGALESGWRGGVYGEVLEDGELAVGDPVSWE